MGAIARLAKQKLGAAGDNLLAEIDKRRQYVLEVHHLRAAAIERHKVHTERALQSGKAPKLIKHHIGNRVALDFNNNAHTVAV